jgi:hypothetical protein
MGAQTLLPAITILLPLMMMDLVVMSQVVLTGGHVTTTLPPHAMTVHVCITTAVRTPPHATMPIGHNVMTEVVAMYPVALIGMPVTMIPQQHVGMVHVPTPVAQTQLHVTIALGPDVMMELVPIYMVALIGGLVTIIPQQPVGMVHVPTQAARTQAHVTTIHGLAAMTDLATTVFQVVQTGTRATTIHQPHALTAHAFITTDVRTQPHATMHGGHNVMTEAVAIHMVALIGGLVTIIPQQHAGMVHVPTQAARTQAHVTTIHGLAAMTDLATTAFLVAPIHMHVTMIRQLLAGVDTAYMVFRDVQTPQLVTMILPSHAIMEPAIME